MSFPVAFQSAVFYFLACTPCAKVRHHQKTKEQAKKERREKARLESEQPGLYRHPSPFNTNPYWKDEITMGPRLPKKSASKNSSQRVLTSSGKDSNAPSVSECTNVGDSRTNFGDSTTVVPEDDSLSQDWNRKRGYQREDEELWGQWSGHKLMDAFSKARDSAGRLIESTLGFEKEVTEQARRDFYFSPKNPPVNDYHPPVVSSKAPHRDAHRWMLQPPPSAKMMEGKIPVSRTVSTGSKSSGRTMGGEEFHLSRVAQERLAKERLKKEKKTPTEEELIESLFLTRSNRSLSFPRSRSLSLDGVDESVEIAYERRQRSRVRPGPVAAPPGQESEGEALSLIQRSKSHTLVAPGSAGHIAQRPKLETIVSAESDSSARVTSSRGRRQQSIRTKSFFGAASPVGDDSD
ncbi:hypothetical protein ACO1O0_001129 [Amphichorda felina]